MDTKQRNSGECNKQMLTSFFQIHNPLWEGTRSKPFYGYYRKRTKIMHKLINWQRQKKYNPWLAPPRICTFHRRTSQLMRALSVSKDSSHFFSSFRRFSWRSALWPVYQLLLVCPLGVCTPWHICCKYSNEGSGFGHKIRLCRQHHSNIFLHLSILRCLGP